MAVGGGPGSDGDAQIVSDSEGEEVDTPSAADEGQAQLARRFVGVGVGVSVWVWVWERACAHPGALCSGRLWWGGQG
jgi:hypothetical protein